MLNSTMPADWLCCAYLRKSREDEEAECRAGYDTLTRHRSIVRDLAEDNDHVISEWYQEVVSGETIAARTEMQRLLADIAHDRWDAVYVVEASRLGRGGGGDQEKIVNAFRYTGTWLLTEEKDYNPASKSDMKLLKNELRKSEDELGDITTRLARGKYRAAKEGIWQATGRTPYGWMAVRIDGLWQLRPDDNHCHMLRIYDLLEAGETFSNIARIYELEGVPTARGGHHWTASAIRAIATNPVNCGHIVYGKRHVQRVFNPETFAVEKHRIKNDDPIIVKGLHYGTGGISEERFQRIMGKALNQAHIHADREMKNPLSTLLKCGKCGYAMNHHLMSSGKSKAYFYLHKPAKFRIRDCDGCKGARASAVIDVLADALASLADDIELELGGETDRASEYARHVEALEKELTKAQAARQRAMEAFEAGAYSVEDFRERKEVIDERMNEIERELDAAKPPERTEKTVTTLRACIDMIRDGSRTPKEVNDFLRSIIKRIDYYNDAPPYKPNNIRLEITLR